MKMINICLLILCFSCSQKEEKNTAESTDYSFEAPENPFKNNSPELAPDTSKKAKKAEKPGMKAAEIEFEKQEIKPDSLTSGKIFKTEINFRNIGEQPLEISVVKSSRKAEINWSKLLIAGSEQSSVSYKINTPEKKGIYIDTIFFLSNAGEDKIILKSVIR